MANTAKCCEYEIIGNNVKYCKSILEENLKKITPYNISHHRGNLLNGLEIIRINNKKLNYLPIHDKISLLLKEALHNTLSLCPENVEKTKKKLENTISNITQKLEKEKLLLKQSKN
ncbi:MAG: hypothetical protein ABIG10_02505 [bacterium]